MNAEEFYQEVFRAEITAQKPESLCDIGCGAGALVAHAQALGIAATGIDPDSNRSADGRAAGLDLRAGTAEALPFADDAFEVVTFENSLHHARDIPRALREAMRVAKRAVIILDPWFDLSIPSQAVCDRFERVLKRADRATGMAHWDPIDAGTILAALDAPVQRASIRHLLQLTPVTSDTFEAMAHRAIGQDPSVATELEASRTEAARIGMTDAGELLMTLYKRG